MLQASLDPLESWRGDVPIPHCSSRAIDHWLERSRRASALFGARHGLVHAARRWRVTQESS